MNVCPAREVRDLPEPPRNYWRLVGPGIVAGGVGLSSGEFVLWPYIASQVGLVLLWGALVGVVTQFFLNMEVERYTLATGETVLTGFNRFWRHWGLLFAVMGYFANLWPGWAISSATLTSYLIGGNPTYIGVVTLLIIGFSLTLRPGGLRCPRAADLRQGGCGARARRARRGVRDQARVVGRAARGIRAYRDPAGRPRHCARLQRGGVRRVGRRAEPLSEQLDSRQRVRHGSVRAASRQPGDRDAAGERSDCAELHLRDDRRPIWIDGSAGGVSPTWSSSSASS